MAPRCDCRQRRGVIAERIAAAIRRATRLRVVAGLRRLGLLLQAAQLRQRILQRIALRRRVLRLVRLRGRALHRGRRNRERRHWQGRRRQRRLRLLRRGRRCGRRRRSLLGQGEASAAVPASAVWAAAAHSPRWWRRRWRRRRWRRRCLDRLRLRRLIRLRRRIGLRGIGRRGTCSPVPAPSSNCPPCRRTPSRRLSPAVPPAVSQTAARRAAPPGSPDAPRRDHRAATQCRTYPVGPMIQAIRPSEHALQHVLLLIRPSWERSGQQALAAPTASLSAVRPATLPW